MPEVGDVVKLDNGASGRVVEVSEDGITVELLDADGNPTGETVEVEAPATASEAEAPEGDSADGAAAEDASDQAGQNPLRAAVDTILSALGMKRHEPASGFKVYQTDSGPRWVGWWTNNFIDKEGEVFSLKAIDDYVDRVRAGLTPYPELWAYHIPGSKHGEAQWVGRIGHYAVAAGSFDDDALGQRAADVYARSGKKYAMSHGFTYPTTELRDGVFHQFNTFEISTLPARAAANPFTAFEGITKMLTDEQTKELRALFGDEIATEIITNTEAKSKAIEAAGVAYKQFTVVADVKAEAAPEPEAVKSVEVKLGTLIRDLNADSASAAELTKEAMQAMAAHKTATDAELAAMRAEVKALHEALDLRPRSATTDPATEIERSALTESLKAQVEEDNYETVLGIRVPKKTS
jgi:hypothetical protein